MRRKEKENRIPRRPRSCRYRKKFCRQFWIRTISSFGLSQICLNCTFLHDNLSANNYTAYGCTFMGNFIARAIWNPLQNLKKGTRRSRRIIVSTSENNSSTCLKISFGISREIREQKYRRWIYVSIGLLHLNTFNNVLV